MAAKLILAGISMGLSLLGKRGKAEQQQSIVKDHKPSTTSVRGSFMPRLMGRRRLGAVIAWVGNRKAIQIVVGSTPGGKGGGEGKKKRCSRKYFKRMQCTYFALALLTDYIRFTKTGK